MSILYLAIELGMASIHLILLLALCMSGTIHGEMINYRAVAAAGTVRERQAFFGKSDI